MIRGATLHDLPGAYRVCLATGDSGRDATGHFANPDLLGHVYVGPYIAGQLQFASVIADPEGVSGYCLGTLDTRRFESWAEEEWWPPLRAQYPPRDDDTRDAQVTGLIHSPSRAPEAITAGYPSHLHIDLLDRARGRGLGRALIERLVGLLGVAGSPGVHLEVGADNGNAIEFYRHIGFHELERTSESLFMGRRIG